MLILKDCDFQPGDIIFLVSSSHSLTSRIKRAVQSFTGRDRKHGHMETISVFVCTGGSGSEDSFGYQFHNYERQLRVSVPNFVNNLYEHPTEELPGVLQQYCARKELTASKIKASLVQSDIQWMQELGQLIQEDNPLQIFEKMMAATEKSTTDHEKQEKLIALIVFCWENSGHAEVLPSSHSSLLVFRHTNPETRDKFLNEYRKQVEISENYRKKGKSRTSLWHLILSIFNSAAQDKRDRDQTLQPDDATFCAQNVIQVLNKVDPNLVARGRHVTPKSLEAGMRAATLPKILEPRPLTTQDDIPIPEDDFEALLVAEEKRNPTPPFKMMILPKAGKQLLYDFAKVLEQEIHRIKNKSMPTASSKQKAAALEEQWLKLKDLATKDYTINMQVEATLEFLHQNMPILQRKTGWLGAWMPSTSYSNIRAFARQQGIFDGDIRLYAERIKNTPKEPPPPITPAPPRTGAAKTYLFADWSFSQWSTEKRAALLQQMTKILDEGDTVYVWDGQDKKLVLVASQRELEEIINQEDFDQLWSDRVEPITQKQLLGYAQQQHLNTNNITILDYQACNKRYPQNPPFETALDNAAKLFTKHYTPSDLKKTRLNIVAIEMDNAQRDATLLASLRQTQTKIENEPNAPLNYRSGIDTKAAVAVSQRRKPIFNPLNFMTPTPSSRYYRNEVYSELTINPTPTSSFDYFELSGMHDFSDLEPATYQFHSHLSTPLIKERKRTAAAPLFLGEVSLALSHEWQALPSLSRGETLTDIAVESLKAKDVEIQYSKKSGLYFIRQINSTEQEHSASIKILLTMPPGYSSFPVWNTFKSIPGHEDIHALLMKYYQFGKDNKDSLNEAVKSGRIENGLDYLKEARHLKVGSCRLRAIAFKEEMKHLHPEIPVAIDVNSDHGFIEMELDGHWQRYCLGGYRNISTFVGNHHSFFNFIKPESYTEDNTSSFLCSGKR